MNIRDKKIFGTLFFSIFSAATGIGIVVPLLPVYAHDLGASGLYISFIFGAFSFSRMFLVPYFGKISDKNGRKPYIVAGLFGYSVISLAFIFSNSVESLIGIRFLQGIASAMIMPVTQAYIGDITPPGKEGLCMGMFNMSMFLSLSIGPLIGGAMSDHFSLDTSFAVMGGLSFIGFLLSLFLLPPKTSERAVNRDTEPIEWKTLLKDKEIAGLFIFRFVYITCVGIIWCFLPVFADTEFGLSSFSIGILVMLAVFISGLLQVPMGFVADRVNKKLMVVAGGLVVVCAIYAYTLTTGFWGIFWAGILYGIGGGISTPPLMALAVIKGNRTHSMGSVMGLLTLAHSVGMLTGSVLAGLSMDFFGLRHAFPLGSVIMFAGVVFFVFCTHRLKDYQDHPF